MFALGNVFIGNYKIWITTPVFSIHPWDQLSQNLPYFEVLVSYCFNKCPEKIYSIVDLATAPEFKDILYLDSQKRATEKTDPIEFLAYVDRKSSGHALWKLSKVNVQKLLEMCLTWTILEGKLLPSPISKPQDM